MCKGLFSLLCEFFQCDNTGDAGEQHLPELPFNLSLSDSLIIPHYLLQNRIDFFPTFVHHSATPAHQKDSLSGKKGRTSRYQTKN
jgi:hypothetical protein